MFFAKMAGLGWERKFGRCALGDACKDPEGELRPTHKCPVCTKILHPQCGVFNTTLDKILCPRCLFSAVTGVPPRPSASADAPICTQVNPPPPSNKEKES